MKALKVFFLGLIVMTSMSSYADEGGQPQVELRPAYDLGTEAQEVAEIFLNKSVNKCVRQLQRSVYDLNLTKVSKQVWSATSASYRFEFLKLEGGDMAVGTASMEVNYSVERGVFGAPISLYSCKVTQN